jgi:ATP-dependent DNA ligase
MTMARYLAKNIAKEELKSRGVKIEIADALLETDGSIITAKANLENKLGLEGIVSKKLNAPYRSGPLRTWIKVKNPKAAVATRAVDGTF